MSPNKCLAFNILTDFFYKMFHNFRDLHQCVKLQKLEIGSQGIVHLLTRKQKHEGGNYTMETVLKTMYPVDDDQILPDHLLYEYIVGKEMNKFNATPNVNQTLNLYKLKDNHNDNKQLKVQFLRRVCKINDALIADSCKYPPLYAIEQVYVPYSMMLYVKMRREEIKKHSDFIQHDLLCILFQVYAFLRIYQNVYTHYDVHLFNVLIVEVPEYTLWFRYIDTDADREVSFRCRYLVKLIDYGRSYVKNVTERFVESLCTQCEDCGKFQGYYSFAKEKKFENYFNNLYVNRSTDLRLLNMIKTEFPLIQKKNAIIGSLVRKVRYVKDRNVTVTREILKSGKNNNKINNVEDAYEELFGAMKKQQQQQKGHEKQEHKVLGKFTIHTRIVDSISATTPYSFV